MKFSSHLLPVSVAGLITIAGCVINFKNPTPPKLLVHANASYRYPGKCEFNSNSNFYKKELKNGRYAQTEITFDPGQQLLVMNKAVVLHFFQMPDSFYHVGTKEYAPPQYLRIWTDSLDKTVKWSGPIEDLSPSDSLRELVEYVDSIVRSSEAYRGLPSD